MEVLVNVIGQKLRIATNCKTFVGGTRDFIKFVFSLPDDWIGLTIYAQFIQDGAAFNRHLDSNSSAFLPNEIHDGKCELVLYGAGGTTVALTDSVMLNIKRSNHVGDGSEGGSGEDSVVIYASATLEEMKEYLQI